MGNSNGELMSSRDFSSAIGPGQLWRDYMKEIFAPFPATDWKQPANIVRANVTVAPGPFGGYGSGLVPTSLTPFSSSEIFVRGTEPRQPDTWYTQSCPAADGTVKVAMQIKEGGPASWKKYTDLWVADAQKGLRSPVLDEVVRLVDAKLESNRRKAADAGVKSPAMAKKTA